MPQTSLSSSEIFCVSGNRKYKGFWNYIGPNIPLKVRK